MKGENGEEKEFLGYIYDDIRPPLKIPPFAKRDRVEVKLPGGDKWQKGIVDGGENWQDDLGHIRVFLWEEGANGEPKIGNIPKLFDPENVEEMRFDDNVSDESPGDAAGGRYVPKEGIIAANEKQKGHFRLIKKEVWDAYVGMYPGSGPIIVAVEKPYSNPANWEIDQDYMHYLRETGIPPEQKGPMSEVRDIEAAVQENQDSETGQLEQMMAAHEASQQSLYRAAPR